MNETGHVLRTLLGSSVRVGDIRVGVATAVLADRSLERVFGIEVSTQGGGRWFVPWVATSVNENGVQVASALVFGGRDQLESYARGATEFIRGGDDADRVVDSDGCLIVSESRLRVSADTTAGTTRT